MHIAQVTRDMSDAALLIVLFKNLERCIQVSKSLGALADPVGKRTQKGMGTSKLNSVASERALYARPALYLYYRRVLHDLQNSILRGSQRIYISALTPGQA